MAEENKGKLEEKKQEETVKEENKTEKPEDKKETTEAPKEETEGKKDEKPKSESKKPKKTEAVANIYNAHLSTKTSAAVGRFIVGKTIDQAMSELQEVIAMKKPVPMKGEIPHRHGEIMSGRFPKSTAEVFIGLLKELAGNTNVNGLEEPVIAEVISNIGSRPYGKFGAVRRKRSHIKIIAKNKSDWKKSRSKKAKMNKVKKSKNKTEKKQEKK